MVSSSPDIATFEAVARDNSALRWYAIADSAQRKGLPASVAQEDYPVRCLFGASQGSPLAHHSPHLVELCSPLEAGHTWNWISLHGKAKPGLTIIASEMPFDDLFVQLAGCVEVTLPDQFEMFLGFWDPAILGTLMGQGDDHTLHVAGPVLTAGQRSKMVQGTHAWWYWDRDGGLHSLAVDAAPGPSSTVPLHLTQAQVDDLVEASIPDHVLYYVELNQPLLIADTPARQRYGVVREALGQAREIGLSSMNDLVNFVCLTLIYNEQMQTDKDITDLLARVRTGELSFSQALDAIP